MTSTAFGKFGLAGAVCALLQWTTLADPLDTWHQRNSLSQTNPLNSITYAKGLFVAVGEGAIVTSPDGIEWTRRDSGTTPGLGTVVYGRGIFLASDAYSLFRSTDGTNWTSSAWSGQEKIEGLDFANDRFFVLSHDLRVNGDRAIIFTSTNTIDWTRFRTSQSGAASAVTYGNGLYVAVGTGFGTPSVNRIPLVLTSQDAITWTSLDFDSPRYWNRMFADVVYGGNMFLVAVEFYGGGGAFALSPDGSKWTFVTPGLIDVTSLAFGDGILTVVGSVGTLATSTDGLHWTTRDPGTKLWLSGVAYGQNTFVVVGNEGLIFQSDPIVTLGLTRGLSTELSLTGPPGRTCEIHAVDQLLATNNWQTLGMVTLTNSAVSWTDPESTNKPQRFYRAVLQP